MDCSGPEQRYTNNQRGFVEDTSGLVTTGTHSLWENGICYLWSSRWLREKDVRFMNKSLWSELLYLRRKKKKSSGMTSDLWEVERSAVTHHPLPRSEIIDALCDCLGTKTNREIQEEIQLIVKCFLSGLDLPPHNDWGVATLSWDVCWKLLLPETVLIVEGISPQWGQKVKQGAH